MEFAAYACGNFELPPGLLLIFFIVLISRSRRSSRCIGPKAVGQEASAHPAGHRKQTKAHKLQEAPSIPCGGLVHTIEAMLDPAVGGSQRKLLHRGPPRHQPRKQRA